MGNYDYLEAALESVKRFKDYDPQIHDVFARKMTEYTIEQYPDESESHPTTAFLIAANGLRDDLVMQMDNAPKLIAEFWGFQYEAYLDSLTTADESYMLGDKRMTYLVIGAFLTMVYDFGSEQID